MNTAKFKTAIHIEDYKGKPSVVVQYNDALYSGELMRTLAKSVLCAVEHIIENPNGKIRKVSLLDNAAIAQLESFKSTEIAPVKTKLLHKMFEEQVAKAPDRIALSACDGKLTYKELDRLANITANSLIEKGLKRAERFLFCLKEPQNSSYHFSVFSRPAVRLFRHVPTIRRSESTVLLRTATQTL